MVESFPSVEELNARTDAIHRLGVIMRSAREEAVASGISDSEISAVVLRDVADRHPEISGKIADGLQILKEVKE